MKSRSAQCNPYAPHHDLLRRNILSAATVDESLLEDAGIEISQGWLFEEFLKTKDCIAYEDDFEFMKHLDACGELEKSLDDSLLTELARHDVFLALAWHENAVAELFFGNDAAAARWNQDLAVLTGLRAALAAHKAYEFALRLKACAAEQSVYKRL